MLHTKFLEFAANTAALWDRSSLADLGERTFPAESLSRAGDVIRADAYLEWIRWFAEGIVDPRRCVGYVDAYAHVFELALSSVKNRYGTLTVPEQCDLARSVARYVTWRVELIASQTTRRQFSLEEREGLIALAGNPPRCWITGRPFDRRAVDSFLNRPSLQAGTSREVELPLYVDIYRPIGLKARDIGIEVDHVRPVSDGGGDLDNLRLACGWANANKRHYMNLYDVSGAVRVPHLQSATSRVPASLPQAFWVIRLIGTRKRCEHPGGCSADSTSAELTVALIEPTGAPTPTNLRVVCGVHDPITVERLVPRALAASVWGKGRA